MDFGQNSRPRLTKSNGYSYGGYYDDSGPLGNEKMRRQDFLRLLHPSRWTPRRIATVLVLGGFMLWWVADSYIWGGARHTHRLGDAHHHHDIEEYHGVPTYSEVYELEEKLPQHRMNLPFPEGKDGRYIKFLVPYTAVGFNNQLQDIILLAQLAYMSNRAYVFQPFINDEYATTVVVQDPESHKWKSTSVPLNAFISGPIAGGFIPTTQQVIGGKEVEWKPPRSVNYDWFDEVCPPSRRSKIDLRDIRKKYKLNISDNPTGKKILEGFAEEFRNMDAKCLVVGGDHLFTFDHFGASWMLDSWEILSRSPLFQNFDWSGLVKKAVERNFKTIMDKSTNTPSPSLLMSRRLTIPGLMTVHLRRGDFLFHCTWLRDSVFAQPLAWNSFEDYLDHFPSKDKVVNGTKEERAEWYDSRCAPTVEQLHARIRQVKKDYETSTPGRKLTNLYVLTNAEREYTNKIKKLLLQDGWSSVTFTYDIDIKDDEHEIDVAIDMMIAERSELFLGNPFSSLTANVNLIRRARGVAVNSIRFLQ